MRKFGAKCSLQILILHIIISPLSAQSETGDSANVLTPVILTLALAEDKKNDFDAISAIQDKVLASLKNFRTENIKRYRYTPLLALSIGQTGLDFLRTSSHVVAIDNDSLSIPQADKTISDKPVIDSVENKKKPCDQKIK